MDWKLPKTDARRDAARCPKSRPPRWWIIACCILWAIGIGFAVMTPFSFFSYTAIGLDTDRGLQDHIIHSFYRFTWPGDGSFRIGTGTTHYSYDEEDIDVVDLAGRFFRPPQKSQATSTWNRLGFWWINKPDYWDGERMQSAYWVGVPSCLPALLALAAAAICARVCTSAGEFTDENGSSRSRSSNGSAEAGNAPSVQFGLNHRDGAQSEDVHQTPYDTKSTGRSHGATCASLNQLKGTIHGSNSD